MTTSSEPSLSFKMMAFLEANDENGPKGKSLMVSSQEIANVFDVGHRDVLYLLQHQRQMGRLFEQRVSKDGPHKKLDPLLFGLTSDGRNWLRSQRQKMQV